MRTRILYTIVLLILTCLPIVSQAQSTPLNFTLFPAIQTAQASDTVSFNALVTNNTSFFMYINDADVFIGGPEPISPILDLTAFFDNFEFAEPLAPGQTVIAPIMEASIDPMTTPGDYVGSFTLLGGTHPEDVDPLTSPQTFAITVTPTPEPSVVSSMVTGVLVLFASLRRRRKPSV